MSDSVNFMSSYIEAAAQDLIRTAFSEAGSMSGNGWSTFAPHGLAGAPVARVHSGHEGAHPQDRSRSPAISHVAGLGRHPAAAGMAPHALQSAAALGALSEDTAWYTNDTTLDCWVLQTIPILAVRMGLTCIDVQERKQIIRSCMGKANAVQSIVQYFAGCIRKSQAKKELGLARAVQSTHTPDHLLQHVARPLVSMASPSGAEAFVDPCKSAAVHIATANPVASPGGVVTKVAPASISKSVPTSAACNDIIDAPPWARACMRVHDSKSKLLRSFFQHLDAEAAAALSALSPESQAHIVIAACLAWQWSPQPSHLCRRLVGNHAELTLGSETSSRAAAGSPVISLVILHIGSVVGIGHVSLKAAFARVLKDFPSATIKVLEMHSFVVGTTLANIEQAAAALLGVRCQSWSEAPAFARLCQEHGKRWAEADARIMVLINWDGMRDSFSTGSSDDIAESPLHLEPCLTMTGVRNALQDLQANIPVRHLAVLCFRRSRGSDTDIACMQSMLGASQSLHPEQYGVPQGPWAVHASPGLKIVLGESEGLAVPLQVDGWTWSGGNIAAGRKEPSQLTADVLRVVERLVFKEGQLEAVETEQLALFTMTNTELGMNRLLSRTLLLHILGLKDLPLGEVLEQSLPCLRVILCSTGGALPSGVSGGEECGKQRWCLNCEVVVTMLLNSPTAPLLTDTCSAWLRVCLHEWSPSASAPRV